MAKEQQINEVKICALYGRISVDEEVEHGSTEQQKHMGYASAKQLTEVTGIEHKIKYVLIEDKGISGGTINRPQYQKLLSLIRNGAIDVVIAKEISRLNRSTKDFCDFMELCRSNNVAVRVRGLDIDPNTPMGKAMFQMLAVVAELEREMIRERTKSSIRSSMLNNQKIAGGPIILGFNRHTDKKGVWVVVQEEINIVIYLMKTFNETLSYRETITKANAKGIKNKTNVVFNKDSLKRLLTNRRYIGKLRVPTDDGKPEIEVNLPFGAAVPVELFEEVQKNVKLVEEKLHNQNRNCSRIYCLTGLLFYEDGTAFTAKSGTSKNGSLYTYYRNPQNDITVDAEAVENAVVNSLRVYENDKRMIEKVKDLQKNQFSQLDFIKQQIQQIKSELEKLDKEEKGLGEQLNGGEGNSQRILKWLDGKLAEIEEKRIDLQGILIELQREREGLEKQSVNVLSLKSSLKVVFDKLMMADPATKRGIFRQLFKKVEIFKENLLKITWAIPASDLATIGCGGSGNEFASKNEWGRKTTRFRISSSAAPTR